MKAEDINVIEQKIGYVFNDKKLLKICFTHSSYTNEHNAENNERLEFLGDALLGFFVAENLFKTTADSEEQMTEKRKALVAKEPLERAIARMDLAKYIIGGGHGENIGKKAISSLFEALVAGIYLDGGIEEAKNFVIKKLLPFTDYTLDTNYKGKLQEYLQGIKQETARYELIKTTGEAHDPEFYVRVFAGKEMGEGSGKSKKQAEQAAAKNALIKLGVKL